LVIIRALRLHHRLSPAAESGKSSATKSATSRTRSNPVGTSDAPFHILSTL